MRIDPSDEELRAPGAESFGGIMPMESYSVVVSLEIGPADSCGLKTVIV